MKRPPIIVVMGHVDHGKTTLLDYLRKTTVAAREAGGITQSIGAYEIVHNGARMTFIDTPGHEAFSKMRARGAHIADLAILVVAADEGVKPQTVESIATLEATKTPFVVAITKIDKPGADLERVKGELATANVFLEGYGGAVSYQPVSAKSGEHVAELLDLLALAADVENLSYDPAAAASGFVLETKLDRRRGTEAALVVTNGTLRQGDSITTKTASGKVKILEDFAGKAAKELAPSSPALVIGFETLPGVGEEFSAGGIVELAKEALTPRERREAAGEAGGNGAAGSGPEKLRVIVKAADSGSLEALYGIISAMAAEKPIVIVGDAVGDVIDNDVKLAISTGAMVIAFKSRVDKAAKMLAETNKIAIVASDIIYDLVKTIEETIAERGRPKSAGELEVLAVFNITRLDKQVVGGRISHGTVKNRAPFEIRRAGGIAGRGHITNLQQNKKDVSQASEGEAGVLVNAGIAIGKGDVLVVNP